MNRILAKKETEERRGKRREREAPHSSQDNVHISEEHLKRSAWPVTLDGHLAIGVRGESRGRVEIYPSHEGRNIEG